MEHVDVLIVGAGLSGIGAAVHLQRRCPRKTFAILEGRATSGGTWDLFRYPGVRSDSDMYTLGYAFKPWKSPKAIADGAAILAYVRETATEHAIDAKIRYRHKVVAADWSSDEARWTVTIAREVPFTVIQFPMWEALKGWRRRETGREASPPIHRSAVWPAATAPRPRRAATPRVRYCRRPAWS